MAEINRIERFRKVHNIFDIVQQLNDIIPKGKSVVNFYCPTMILTSDLIRIQDENPQVEEIIQQPIIKMNKQTGGYYIAQNVITVKI